MKLKSVIKSLFRTIDKKTQSQFGFKIKDMTYNKLVDYMYLPKDSSSLAFTRILFGLSMLFDIPNERGGAIIEKRWNSNICHFPLLPFVQPIYLPYMAMVYAGLWIGACGIMLGYKYGVTSILFTICYWYLFLIEKSFWNNHTYLFGLVGLLLSCTQANCYWSLDVYLDPSKQKTTVPYWNYFILKYQFFILYFMAGLKKGTAEWLTGYSVPNLSEHWVFTPFKLFFTEPQIDYFIVHWFVFVFDLTVATWMMYSPTRHIAMVFCAMFHLMNSRLFKIGMFPWVCLATMPLFYPFNWPKRILRYIKQNLRSYICKMNCKNNCDCKLKENDSNDENDQFSETTDDDEEYLDDVLEPAEEEIINKTVKSGNQNAEVNELIETTNEKIQTDGKKSIEEAMDNLNKIVGVSTMKYKNRKVTVFWILIYVFIQAFLPYSHFITKGFNNWTNGLYGYSWDMMVHTWDTHSVIVKTIDNSNKWELFLDPFIYTPNDRWTRHGDMVYQYAKCIKNKIIKKEKFSNNISVYVDIWISMNGRFTQRMFNSKVDLLKADWSPFKKIDFVMPLLDDGIYWRKRLVEIKKDVQSWNNSNEVIFLADFPGYKQEKFIPLELKNVTLTVLEGKVAYEPDITEELYGLTYKLINGDRMSVDTGIFHSVRIIGNKPAFYMYTFYNTSENNISKYEEIKAKSSIVYEVYSRSEKDKTRRRKEFPSPTY